MTDFNWHSEGLDGLMPSTGLLFRPERTSDGDGFSETIPEGGGTEIRCAVTVYENETQMVFDAAQDVRVGDIIQIPATVPV